MADYVHVFLRVKTSDLLYGIPGPFLCLQGGLSTWHDDCGRIIGPGPHKTWVLLPHLILYEAIQKPNIDLTQAITEAHLNP